MCGHIGIGVGGGVGIDIYDLGSREEFNSERARIYRGIDLADDRAFKV